MLYFTKFRSTSEMCSIYSIYRSHVLCTCFCFENRLNELDEVLDLGGAKHVDEDTKARFITRLDNHVVTSFIVLKGQRNKMAIRIGFEGGQTPFYLRIPKHGFKNK